MRRDSKEKSKKVIYTPLRPGSNAVLHMSRTQLGSSEVRRLTQLSSTDFIWSSWSVLHAWPAVKNAWRPTLSQTPTFTSAEPNAKSMIIKVKSCQCINQPQMYESASISVFFQHGCLARWFWGWRWWRFLYVPRVVIIYAWIIAVNVFAYSTSFSQSASS